MIFHCLFADEERDFLRTRLGAKESSYEFSSTAAAALNVAHASRTKFRNPCNTSSHPNTVVVTNTRHLTEQESFQKVLF